MPFARAGQNHPNSGIQDIAANASNPDAGRWAQEMKRYRQLLNRMDDQIAPIWFVLGFHLVIHILGIFVMVQLPYSWRLGTPSRAVPVPAFSIVVWISVLSFVWASLRLAAFRPVRLPVLILLFIPIVMSVGTMAYAHTVTKCTATGRAMLEYEFERLNERIDRLKEKPHRVWWEMQERDRLKEELN